MPPAAGTAGPFTLTAQNYILTNSGVSSLNWSLINTSLWLTASSSSGTLGAGGQTTVMIGLNAAASNLVAGIYPATLIFSNQSSHVPQSLLFTLQSGQSFVQNGGFETGDLSFWTLNGTTTSGGFLYNGVVNAGTFTDGSGTNFVHSGADGMAMGEAGALAYLSQTLNTFPPELPAFILDEQHRREDAESTSSELEHQFTCRQHPFQPGEHWRDQ